MKRICSIAVAWAVAVGFLFAQTTVPGPALPTLPDVLSTRSSGVKTTAPQSGTLAKQPGRTQTTVITSDDLQMDMDKKVATFVGHVKVVDPQGTMTSDKMIVHMAQDGDNENGVQKMEAYGGVIISQEGRKAISDEAIYTANDKILVLTGAAQVETSSGIVSGETIIYDMGKNTAVVKGRPRMKIEKLGEGVLPSVPKPAAATVSAPAPAPVAKP